LQPSWAHLTTAAWIEIEGWQKGEVLRGERKISFLLMSFRVKLQISFFD
jgi:hypothetical protein